MSRSRAVILPTPGDPFLVSYWLRQFERWRTHVDKLYVVVSHPQAFDVELRLCQDIEAAGGQPLVLHTQTEHGAALEHGLAHVREHYVFMPEDDLYINDASIVEWGFQCIERERAIVGVSRGSMSAEIHEAVKERYPGGAGLWPFVFARTEDLRAIREPFNARVWKAGEVVRGVGYYCTAERNADTFGAAAMELRGRHKIIEAEQVNIPDGRWYHVGSLSSGPHVPEAQLDHVRDWRGSWIERVKWWQRFYDEWPGGLPEQHTAYGESLARLHATLAE